MHVFDVHTVLPQTNIYIDGLMGLLSVSLFYSYKVMITNAWVICMNDVSVVEIYVYLGYYLGGAHNLCGFIESEV